MNLPPLRNAALRSFYDAPGSPSSHQIEMGMQQMASREGAIAPAGQSQMLSGVMESMTAAEMPNQSAQNLASQLAMSRVADLKNMAGLVDGAQKMQAQFGGMNMEQALQAIGM